MAKFQEVYRCIAPTQKGGMRKGAVHLERCKQFGYQPVIARNDVRIPGLVNVTRGQQVVVCNDHARMIGAS